MPGSEPCWLAGQVEEVTMQAAQRRGEKPGEPLLWTAPASS